MTEEVELSVADAEELAIRACLGAGASDASARSLAKATLSAARFGPPVLGFPHMMDYLNSFREGRINGHPTPTLSRPFPASLVSDADGGIAQLGFDIAFDDIVEAVRDFGIALFTQTNSYTTGELGYYTRRLAEAGLVGLAATNAHATVVSKGGGLPVYSTNPMAFGFPLGEDSLPLVIDQSSSATAYVNIVAAAAEDRPIPTGWAVDENGQNTQDPHKALNGALLPFGGRKGGNVALIVEMLSAGVSGGPWSLDTPDALSGELRPAVGLTIIAMMPGAAAGGGISRAFEQVRRLQSLGVFIPGVNGVEPQGATIRIPVPIYEATCRFKAASDENQGHDT